MPGCRQQGNNPNKTLPFVMEGGAGKHTLTLYNDGKTVVCVAWVGTYGDRRSCSFNETMNSLNPLQLRHDPVLNSYTMHTYNNIEVKSCSLWSPYVIGRSPYVIGQTIIFLPCSFFLLLSSSSFIPRLISAAAGWMSTIR